jgi:hypothetical protein
MRAGVASNTSSVAATRELSRMSFVPESERGPERLVTLSALTQLSAKVRCLDMSV